VLERVSLQGAPRNTRGKHELLNTLVKMSESSAGVCIYIFNKLLHFICCLHRTCAYFPVQLVRIM
jgi:hypothetical protein